MHLNRTKQTEEENKPKKSKRNRKLAMMKVRAGPNVSVIKMNVFRENSILQIIKREPL